MKKIVLFVYLAIISCYVFGQVTLIREGAVINNTETGSWEGDNIPRTQPTILTYRNNSITSVNTQGYLLQSGDETPLPVNNNLDGQVVTGNKFVWNGINAETVITHCLFVGYNINSTVKYNYIDKAPYAIIFKSGTDDGENMTFTSGGCAYNICKNGKMAVRMKGINGVKVYNNTFYNGDGSGWYFLLITSNSDRPVTAPSTGTKVFNNIFYSTTTFPMIQIESGCFTGFECDYNVYFCTQGEPTFIVDDRTTSWSEWRALGYDAHSVIVNPNFNNSTDLVPSNPLDFGKNLGIEWQAGLSATATWNVGNSPAITNQNGTWQVGARVTIPTGIDENKKKIETQWTIIPGSKLKIESDPKFKLGKAALYTIHGTMVEIKNVESEVVAFDISKLPSGVYIVVLSKGVNSNIVKVLIP